MSIGSFLFGSPGGVPKDVKKSLYGAYNKYQNETPDPAYAAYARSVVEPGFARARQDVAGQYANADAPIVSGGRTLANIDLAGKEGDVLGGMMQDERKRKAELAKYYLQLLTQGTMKAPSQGLFGSIASGAGAFMGAQSGGGAKPNPALLWGTGAAFPV